MATEVIVREQWEAAPGKWSLLKAAGTTSNEKQKSKTRHCSHVVTEHPSAVTQAQNQRHRESERNRTAAALPVGAVGGIGATIT